MPFYIHVCFWIALFLLGNLFGEYKQAGEFFGAFLTVVSSLVVFATYITMMLNW